MSETELIPSEIEEQIDANTQQEVESGYIQDEDAIPTYPQDPDESPVLLQAQHVKEEPKEQPTIKEAMFATRTPQILYRIIAAVASLCDELTFAIDPEGLKVRVMDPAHIALADIVLPNMMFDVWDVTSAFKFAVRVDELKKLLKEFNASKDSLKVTITTGGYDSTMKLDNGSLHYQTRLVEHSASDVPSPKLSFNTEIKMSSQELANVMKRIQNVSEYMVIESRHDKITFSGKGDSGEAALSMEPGSEGLESLTVREDSRAIYSLDYLQQFHKALAVKAKKSKHGYYSSDQDDVVTMEYSKQMPLRLTYTIERTGKIQYYLAPRVQD